MRASTAFLGCLVTLGLSYVWASGAPRKPSASASQPDESHVTRAEERESRYEFVPGAVQHESPWGDLDGDGVVNRYDDDDDNDGCSDRTEEQRTASNSERHSRAIPARSSAVRGALMDEGDTDWYRLQNARVGNGVSISNVTSTAKLAVNLCAYVACPGARVTCPADAIPDVSPDGRSGCCADDGLLGTEIKAECPDQDLSDVYVRVETTPASSCTTYSFEIR